MHACMHARVHASLAPTAARKHACINASLAPAAACMHARIHASLAPNVACKHASVHAFFGPHSVDTGHLCWGQFCLCRARCAAELLLMCTKCSLHSMVLVLLFGGVRGLVCGTAVEAQATGIDACKGRA